MRNHIIRTITILAALAVTALAVAMAWASSMQRASARQDQLLLAALSVVIVAAVHLLPGLLRGRHALVVWPVWLMCLVLAAFGHASWFYLSAESAAEVRQAGSAAARAAAQERADIEQVLRTIKARPLATVAAQLARTTDPDRREALALELAEARRAAGLRDRLIAVSVNASGNAGNTATRRETVGNAVATRRVTVGRPDMTMVMSVVAAVVIELLGALLWSAALSCDDDAEVDVQQVVNALAPIMSRPTQAAGAVDGTAEADEVADLRAAIAQGRCRDSVRGIREYMGCRMETATRLKRSLDMTA